MKEGIVYEGRELEAMSFARKYHRWILEIFEPYFGSRLVEVGAGSGAITDFLLERRLESLSLIEPAHDMYRRLTSHLEALQPSAEVRTFNATFRQVADTIRAEQRPDSIIYINVMEHIADDEAELRAAYETLERGGRLFIFVPALPWLYGSFDRLIRHYRRYTRSEMENKCAAAGFRVVRAHYFDLLGVLPWWVKYCLLKSEAMERGAVEYYDRFFVPVIKGVESVVRPPIGKNLILIAEKD